MSNEQADETPPERAGRWTWERALRERSATEGLTPTAQHVALMMSTYADPAGEGIWPSITTLCAATGRGRSVVNSALRELRDSGWIEQVRRGSGMARKTSEYRLRVPPVSGQPNTNKQDSNQ
jgi:hypothetical protein